MKTPSRDISVDALRGIAIFIMIFANMGPLITEPHSWFYRVIGSMAAPTFITLAGMMVALGVRKNPSKGFAYYLGRGVFILVVAALIDMGAWSLKPFTTVDVLYLIGVGLPVAYLAAKLPVKATAAIVCAIYIATPFLQQLLGYTPYPTEFTLDGKLTHIIKGQTSILNHWLIDGWFPLFPWLGTMLSGVAIGRLRWDGPASKPARGMGAVGSMMLVVGAILFSGYSGPLYSRFGYSEIFYPVTAGFMLLSLGFVLVMLALIDIRPEADLWGWFRPLGECALFVYIAHSFILGRVYSGWLHDMHEVQALPYYAALVALMMVLALLLRKIRAGGTHLPQMVRWIIGA